MALILIAEDEKDIRELIQFSLTFAGFEVITASNGKELVETAKSMAVKPNLIMSDVRMPHMNGYEACAEIKKESALKDIPVILLSAKGQESEIQAGLESGAYEYILKPFAPDELIKRVTDIVSSPK